MYPFVKMCDQYGMFLVTHTAIFPYAYRVSESNASTVLAIIIVNKIISMDLSSNECRCSNTMTENKQKLIDKVSLWVNRQYKFQSIVFKVVKFHKPSVN